MARDPLDIIEQKESGGKNVPNYKYGPGFSASGYYQMIDGTWRRWAKGAGIDISEYPTAMSAPKEVQRAVAEYGFQKEGFAPWEATKHLVGQEANYSPTAHVSTPAKAAADKVAPVEGPLPNSPLPESATVEQLRGILTQDDPFAKLAEERAAEERTAQQVAAAAAAARQQQPVPQPPPAPVMPPIAPPVDYSALLLPRLKRGLLAESGYGGLLG